MKEYINFILVKPETIKKGQEKEVKKDFLNRGIQVLYETYKNITNDDIQVLYGRYGKETYFKQLQNHLLGEKVYFFIIKGHYPHGFIENLVGDTPPETRGKTSLRGKYGLNILKNGIHSSKLDRVIYEITHFFPDLNKKDLTTLFSGCYLETELILNGGSNSLICNNNKLFFEEIFLSYQKEDIILYIPFARHKEDRNSNKMIKYLDTFMPGNYNIKVANENELVNQILTSRYIYISGGDYKKLRRKLECLRNQKYIFHGKKVIGASAGANILAAYSYSNDYDSIFKGLHLASIKSVCHYKNESKISLKLKQHDPSMPSIYLYDTEYIKIPI